jgi:hypothetical protein
LVANVTLQLFLWTIFGFAWKPAKPLRSRLFVDEWPLILSL